MHSLQKVIDFKKRNKYGKSMISFKRKIDTDLHIFLGVIATLVTIGLLFIYSSSSVYALEHFRQRPLFC